MTWVATPCCAEICASDMQHKRGRQPSGVRRAAAASHRLSAVVALGLCCDVELVLHLGVGRPARVPLGRGLHSAEPVRLKIY